VVVGGGTREFMNNADGPAFLERELVGLGVNGYRQVRVRDRASGTVPIHTFREHLNCSPNVKSFTFFTLELVYQVGGFADYSQVGVAICPSF
jgi:hypothetical protein